MTNIDIKVVLSWNKERLWTLLPGPEHDHDQTEQFRTLTMIFLFYDLHIYNLLFTLSHTNGLYFLPLSI